MKFKPIRSTSLQEAIYDQLVEAIVSGVLQPEERLSLETIATQFGVSIMPVREAFRKLEATKLVTRGKNRSLTVSKLSVENIREILSIRLMLEQYAAENAVDHRTDETIELLESLHMDIEKAESLDVYLSINRDFHFAIYKSAKLPILLDIIESLWQRHYPYLYLLHRKEKSWVIDKVMQYHQGMIDALKKKNKREIKEWITKDLTDATERIIALISQS